MIKKKLTKILGVALLSATVITGASPAFANSTAKSASQDTASSEYITVTEDSNENESIVSSDSSESAEENSETSNAATEDKNSESNSNGPNSDSASEKNGWVVSEDGKVSYYKNNEMVTGWINLSPSETYYFHEDGSCATGWTEIDGKMYYFEACDYSDGYRLICNTFIDGYYLDKDGVRHDDDSFVKRGWIQAEDGSWTHYNSDGSMNTGFCTLYPEQTYYFDKETGASLSGWQEINGKEYYFKPANKGYVMVTNDTIDGKHINSLGFVEDPATAIKRGWIQTEDGGWSHYTNNGTMDTGFCTLYPEHTYYFDKETGVSLSGWQEINGNLYYFKADDYGFRMVTNDTIDGIYIDKDGHAQK